MHIKLVKTLDTIKDAWGLLELHRNELATYKDLMILNPDIEKYKALEDAGKLFTLALYDEERIVGYSVFILTTALHYSDLNIASNDILYVHPDYRKSKWGLELINMSERFAKDKGMKMITWHGKENTIFTALMPKLGYKIQDITFSKVL
ncbi:MAG: GNAT family N-acetyltransferase [Patescibacteria group bacterium]|nr:GNAT family N-acetyltransferase [Patescibacteria group bacterium]